MATKIRLKRIGRRNRPFYRLVIMDSRKRRDGAAIEQVGWYNPIAKDDLYSLKEDRILHWLKEGAQPTDTVHDILRTSGLAFKWHLIQQGLSDADIEKEMKKWLLEREDVLARRKQRAEAKAAKKKETSKKKSVEAAPAEEAPAEEAAPDNKNNKEPKKKKSVKKGSKKKAKK